MSNPSKLTHADLRQFTGTEQWFHHPLNRNVRFTEGIQFLAARAAAYWLLDDIAIAQLSVRCLAREPFQA